MLIRYLDHSMADDLFLQHIALLEHLHNGVFRDGFVLYVGYRVVKLGLNSSPASPTGETPSFSSAALNWL